VKSKDSGTHYALGATLIALGAIGVGRLLVDSEAFVGVAAGAGAALALQLVVFVGLGLLLLPSRRLLLFGLGMGARIFSVVVLALLAPQIGLPLAPTLFTLVTVFVLTSLLEPLLFLSEPQRAS
jgi:hypothetical protein